ncbi:MFS general substrate transporter [Cryphonectria parasitica EP155]|uniref:MFS general substrate transporter n=1 Tax=Cryphonectria parasitica (strain ATCC 38755 / EP155) TaxID=660469 RepID=A0A9P5CJP5_CRYP1|nr:MFS general substrate transporter [Cryphonectria parasitica EP155]KAF3761434.1 MFS general substrate transporter [Cryphonectria parasitica EP155]
MTAEISLARPGPPGSDHHPEPPPEESQPPKDTSASVSGQTVHTVEATERRLVRKLDRRLVVLAFLCYLAAFLDRSNIGNAQTAGMGKDLGLSDAQYQWLLTIFYIPYIIFEWLALMWKITPPHIWAAATVLTWAVASILQAASFSWSSLMACRWFLATAEAGFGPGMPYLFSFYYNRRELGVRCGIFLSAAPLATTFAGALAYGITGSTYRIASWRLLFIIEALPPLLLSLVVFFVLPDSAASAGFLTEHERALARARALRTTGQDDTGTSTGTRLGHIDWAEVVGALRTPQVWVQALMYFSCNVAFASLPVFLPAVLTGMGFTSVNAQGLTAPPYFLAFLVCIASTWLGDRTQQRGLLITLLSAVGCTGYILLAACRAVAVRYVGVFLAAAGVFPAIANILSWLLNNQRGDTRRGAGIAVMNIIGQCGPLLGTRVFLAAEGPYYVKGLSACAAFMFLNAVLAFGLRTYFSHMNKRWDREASQRQGSMAGHVASSSEKVDVAGVESKMSSEWRFAL